MIGVRPPSLQREYDDFWSGDPAILQPPEPLAEGASEEQRKAWIEDYKAYAAKLERARETGNWSEIVVGPEQPTKFTLRPLPAHAYALLADMAATSQSAGESKNNVIAELAFRVALVRVTNLGKAEIKRGRHPELAELGQIASTSFFDEVGIPAGVALEIVQEIGGAALMRARQPSPKS